ncbi:MAG: hypothetical protein AAF384_01090 [Pseudomonadota bacterium]
MVLNRRKQAGQSFTEYMVIVTWGILVLFNDPLGDAMTALVDAMKDAHRGMIFTLSLSDPPQADSVFDYGIQLANKRVEDARETAVFQAAQSGNLGDYATKQLVDYAGEKIGDKLESKTGGLVNALDMEEVIDAFWPP